MNFSQFINEFTGLHNEPISEFISAILIFLIIFSCGTLFYFIIKKYIFNQNKKTKVYNEIFQKIRKPTYILFIVVGFRYAIASISALKEYKTQIDQLLTIASVIVIAYIIIKIIDVFVNWYDKKNKQRIDSHILFTAKKIIHVIVYIVIFILILNIFKIDLSGLIVGFGVGGIVLAFALQNVLADVFSAFSIFFDRPFEIGDYIIIDNLSGTVKKIGLKSTRIQLLQGEELILANKELENARIRNFKKMKKRRIAFKFGVEYETSTEKLKKIPEIIKTIISSVETTEFDRVHFTEFGLSSLLFDVVYYVTSSEYITFVDVQQKINFRIKEEFEKEDIKMAFPTQTIFVKNTK